MNDTSIADALIHFTELDLREYATIVDAVEDMFRNTYVEDKVKENFIVTTFIEKEYKDALNIMTWLLRQFEIDDPFYGTLTRFTVEDELTSKYKPMENENLTMNILTWILKSVIYMQFLVNDAIGDMVEGKPLDLKKKYNSFSQVEIPIFLCLDNEGYLSDCFMIRSVADYYSLLMMFFIASKPNIARCQCCGRYFIPKTNKKTLYCDRKIKGDKTCKDIAPALKHKFEADDVILAFDRANQKMYKRYERQAGSDHPLPKGMEYTDYYEWREKAFKIRNDYLIGEISKEDALSFFEE